MKTLSYSSLESNSRKGVALIIVLSMLVLLSAVMVAFMGTVSTERLAQRAAYSGFEAHQAAESAVNLVMSQIRAATTEAEDGSQSWASQPGVIRTFGQTSRVYKLYSHPRMQVTDSSYQPESLDESGINPANLLQTPKGFVDLNQVVLTPGTTPNSVEPHYPIVDPRAALSRQGNDAEPGKGRVEGFWAPQTMLHFSRQRDQSDIPIRELPMRVQWLYQLRDGTFAAADPDSNKIPGADRKNPPVARVAFWTDDESSKINVNTAGENTYWDQPLASGYHESGDATSSSVDYSRGESAALSASQPTAGEFQRFPGHPATTNLSPALRWLYPPAPAMKDEDFKEAIYRLTPRLRSGQGGSVSGTKANFDDSTPDYRYAKRDRLFATLDEFWFRPDRSPISGKGYFGVFRPTSSSTVPDPTYVDSTATPKITPQAIEQLRFFLTANSRAPELNLFGLPRVSIWPVHERDEILVSANSKRSGYDDLMAFCATVNGKPYYFTRAQPWSPTHDYEVSGPESTEVTRKFPGRNKQLMLGTPTDSGYLKRLGERNIPGAGGSFSSKYATVAPPPAAGYNEFDRILLTIFDYIRSTNLIDTGRRDASETGYKLAYTPGYSPSQPPKYGKGDARVLGSGQVTPTVIYASKGQGSLKGFGRFINLAEVGLLFYHDPSVLPGTNEVAPQPSVPQQGTADGTDVISIRCVLIPEMVTVSGYYPGISEGFAYRVRETTPLKISDAADPATERELELAKDDFNFVDVNPWQIEYGRFWMPTRGWNNQFWTLGSGSKTAKQFSKPNLVNGGVVAYRNYPFYSKRFDLIRKIKPPGQPQPPASEFKLAGGTLEFEFYTLNVSPSQTSSPPNAVPANIDEPIQKITITFPDMTLPVPKKGSTPFQQRIQSEASDGGRSWMTTSDIVRTMEPNSIAVKGDYRHVAGLTNVPADYWEPSGTTKDEYKNKTIERLHNFRSGWGRGYENARYGRVANGATQRGSNWNEKIAKIPARVGDRNYVHSMDGLVTGDFDRGMSKHVDGAMINKPDEGNSRFSPGDNPAGGGHLPYYRGGNGYEEVGITFFSPNRLIASAVMFGSLPSGIFARRPWETLLFCPPTTAGHRGAASPADHYLLDWFHMPVVEPYAISEPLATSGKVNLNSRLAPFGYVKMPNGRSYIQRHTGLYGVFKRMRQLAVENGTANGGHNEEPLKETGRKFRFEVDPEWFVNEIVDPALDDRKYFKSATEVCELDLPLKSSFTADNGTAGKFKPKYKTGMADRRTFWENHNMTGDNSRERAYAHIYPRLTTKSNVYTVHVWAQSLAKTGNWDEFDETKDRIIGEYRGSTTFERYIDPKDPALDDIDYDAVEQSDAKSLDRYYRFRVINQKRFNPQ